MTEAVAQTVTFKDTLLSRKLISFLDACTPGGDSAEASRGNATSGHSRADPTDPRRAQANPCLKFWELPPGIGRLADANVKTF